MTSLPVIAAVGAVVVTATAVGLLHQGATASIGAGTQPGPIYVSAAAGTSRTARVQVRDTGSGAETLTITGGWERGSHILPFSWVSGSSIAAAPGVWRTVRFTIAVPAGTAQGQYRRLVGAGVSPAANPGGAAFGATGFTLLVITVVPSATSRHATRGNAHTTSTAPGA